MIRMRSSLLFSLTVAAFASQTLAQNDDCSNALPVVQGLNGPYSNFGALPSLPAWACTTTTTNDVWFAYVAPAAGALTVDTCSGASFDTLLEVFSGSCGSLTSLGCNDDSCGLQSSVTVNVNASATYYIRVAGYSGAMGTFTLGVNGPLGTGVVATNTSVGSGCIRSANSFYSLLPDAAAASTALAGNTLMLMPTGNGYQGVWLPGTATSFFTAPVAPTPLATGDDGSVVYALTTGTLPTPQGAQSSVIVSGNGIVSWGGTTFDYPGTTSFTPTPNGMLNSTLGGIYAWHDYNQTELGSGAITAEEAGGKLYVTWNNVENYPTGVANPGSMQFQFDLSSGIVMLMWPSVDSNISSPYGSGHLIGYSAPGASIDPGAVALATAPSWQLATSNAPEVAPLNLIGFSRPVTNTSWNLQLSNIPATGVLGVDVFGVSDPGIDDLTVIGAPTCGVRASLDYLGAWTVAGATHAYSLPIPNDPALLNLHVYTTSAVFQNPPVNAFGAITSNGIDGKIGDA
jgi:hypothetical protein